MNEATNSIPQNKKAAPVLKVEQFTGEQTTDTPPSENSHYEKFLDSILDQTKDYPAPIPVISFVQGNEQRAFLTLKSVSLWQGKQKSKKTTVLAISIAGFLRGEAITEQIQFIRSTPGKVIFFDTEQGESYAARTMKLILKLAGLDHSPDLIYCDLRAYSPADRLKIIRAGIEGTPGVVMVVIDGLVDLLTDFMDAGEGHYAVTEILRLSSVCNIHVAVVLHQNKADKNARAHVGTISSQKCEIEISTEVDADDKHQSIVTCINSRDMPIEPFAIRWDRGALPCINQDWQTGKPHEVRAVKNYEKSKEVAESVFKPFTALSHADAITGIMQLSLKSKSTAKRLLEDFQEWGLITKGADGNYRINTQGSRVQSGFISGP